MKTIRRQTAVAVFCLSSFSLAAPPAATPAPAAPAKVAAAPMTEYPLTCTPAAKALAFKGWDQLTNSRQDEARESFKQAIAADPKCVMARAQLATLTAGAEGKKMFEEVLTQTAGLSEVEKLDIQGMEARRNGDPEKAYALAQKRAALAPKVFIVHMNLAMAAQALEKFAEMAAATKTATELNPKAGPGWNLMGYALLNQKKNDEAVAAFRKYVEVSPSEPNAHDSLADALLTNNQLDEAAAEYQKAIDTSGGKFWISWSGIATVKALKADWEGARAALASMKAGAVEAGDKLGVNTMTAWSWLAQGKLADALKVVDAGEKEAVAAKLDWAIARAPLTRGQLSLAGGKYAEALKLFATAEKASVEALTEGQKKFYRAMVLDGLMEAQAKLGKAADAEKTVATMEEFYKTNLTGPTAADAMAFGRGQLALAKKDAKGAVESFKQCSEQFDYCRLALADAQDKAGDGAGATETRTALLKANHREAGYWFVHAQVEAKLKVPGKKVAAEGKK